MSAAVQQPLRQLEVDNQLAAAATNIEAYFTELETRAGTNRIWIALQDTLGRCYLQGNSVDSTIGWRNFVASNHTFADVAINAETFATTDPKISCHEDWRSQATREKARQRLMDYSARSVRLGATPKTAPSITAATTPRWTKRAPSVGEALFRLPDNASVRLARHPCDSRLHCSR